MQLQGFCAGRAQQERRPAPLHPGCHLSQRSDYQRAAQSEALTAEKIAPLYAVPASAVQVINYPLGRAIKIVIPRRIMSGDPGDRDVYGAQQHTPLLRLEI